MDPRVHPGAVSHRESGDRRHRVYWAEHVSLHHTLRLPAFYCSPTPIPSSSTTSSGIPNSYETELTLSLVQDHAFRSLHLGLS